MVPAAQVVLPQWLVVVGGGGGQGQQLPQQGGAGPAVGQQDNLRSPHQGVILHTFLSQNYIRFMDLSLICTFLHDCGGSINPYAILPEFSGSGLCLSASDWNVPGKELSTRSLPQKPPSEIYSHQTFRERFHLVSCSNLMSSHCEAN